MHDTPKLPLQNRRLSEIRWVRDLAIVLGVLVIIWLAWEVRSVLTPVMIGFALAYAINPLVTLLGFEIAGLLSGVGLVEIVFSWPGLGNMMLDALLQLDLNVSMAGLVMGAMMLLLGNLLADILLALVDPRIQLEA